jgi:hypothetical protein
MRKNLFKLDFYVHTGNFIMRWEKNVSFASALIAIQLGEFAETLAEME